MVGNWNERRKTGRSAIVHSGPYRLWYHLGETTRKVPGTVGIMAFDTMENAHKFTQSPVCFIRGKVAILKCVARTVEDLPDLRFITFSYNIDVLRKVLTKKQFIARIVHHIFSLDSLPKGTIIVNSLKPIEDVSRETGI